MIEGFWRIGRRIVEEEQQGSIRANYGEQVIAQLSKELGKGFSERTLRDYRRFYLLLRPLPSAKFHSLQTRP